MSGAFNHALHAAFEGSLLQLAEVNDFFHLGGITGIYAGAGTECVTKGQRDVVFEGYVKKPVKAVDERIFFLVFQHPAGQHGTAAGNDAHNAGLVSSHAGAAVGNAAVDGHEIDTLLRLLFNFVKEFVRLERGNFPVRIEQLFTRRVHGYGSQGNAGSGEHIPADGVKITGYGEIHDRVCAGFHGGVQFFHFHFGAVAEGRSPDVGVDLDAGRLPDKNGFHILVTGIAKKHHGAFGNAIEDDAALESFPGAKIIKAGIEEFFEGLILIKDIGHSFLQKAAGRPFRLTVPKAPVGGAGCVPASAGLRDR